MKKMKLFVPDKASSHRQEKVAEEIRHLVADIFIRGDLPTLTDEHDKPVALNTPVTVTRVSVSPDLHHATVYIMPLGGTDREFTMAYLAEVAPHVRHLMSKKLTLRIAPTVAFVLDQSLDYADHIYKALKKL